MTGHVNSQDIAPVWYIVKARPSSVMRAGEEVLNLGMTVYIPQKRKEYRHPRQNRWTTKYCPILESYFFVLATEHWARALGCESVERILRSKEAGDQGLPVPVPDATVATVREAQEAGEFDELKVHGRMVKVGDAVRVSEGALAGLKGTVDATGDEQLTILVSMLGRQVKTKVPLEILARNG
ncbi:transcription termination/antitermination protein NusG [Mesorhizobium marinum]|uniref:transcription termination/antitermination protein NusG n=1 Tax=Mesorhizobium marinum TaxID=3228790 RepID=UPI003466DC89